MILALLLAVPLMAQTQTPTAITPTQPSTSDNASISQRADYLESQVSQLMNGKPTITGTPVFKNGICVPDSSTCYTSFAATTNIYVTTRSCHNFAANDFTSNVQAWTFVAKSSNTVTVDTSTEVIHFTLSGNVGLSGGAARAYFTVYDGGTAIPTTTINAPLGAAFGTNTTDAPSNINFRMNNFSPGQHTFTLGISCVPNTGTCQLAGNHEWTNNVDQFCVEVWHQ